MGALTTKVKANLQDVAQALGLLTTGGKKELLNRITHHFDMNPDLRNTLRYEGLFNCSRRRLGPVQDENHTPNAQIGSHTASHPNDSKYYHLYAT